MNTISQELEELAGHIRKILPDRRKLTRMEQNEEAGMVEFTWSTREFVVRRNLATFEVRGRTLIITGASTLMQATLRTKDRHARIVGAVIEAIRAAEDNLRANPEKSFALLGEVKNTLLKLARKPKPEPPIASGPTPPLVPIDNLASAEPVTA